MQYLSQYLPLSSRLAQTWPSIPSWHLFSKALAFSPDFVSSQDHFPPPHAGCCASIIHSAVFCLGARILLECLTAILAIYHSLCMAPPHTSLFSPFLSYLLCEFLMDQTWVPPEGDFSKINVHCIELEAPNAFGNRLSVGAIVRNRAGKNLWGGIRSNARHD